MQLDFRDKFFNLHNVDIAMTYNTIVEYNENGLLMIIEAAEQFEEARFLESVRLKSVTLEEVRDMTVWVKQHKNLLEVESLHLAAFSEHFLSDYATDNNNCFETAQRLFNRIRSTVAASRKVFKKTCPIVRGQQPRTAVQPSAIRRSVLSHGPVNLDLFGLKSYDDCVRDLYEELKSFFRLVILNLALCHRILCDEKKIKNDAELCKHIYDKCLREVKSSAWEIKKSMADVQNLPASELAERKRNARSMGDFYRENYHKWNRGQFQIAVALEVLREGQNDGLTDIEVFLWPDNHAKALQVREAIGMLDRMKDIEGNPGKWDSKIIVYLLKWSGVEGEKEKFLYEKYLIPEYKRRGGRFMPLGWNAISTERKKLLTTRSPESLANLFEMRFVAASKQADCLNAGESSLLAVNF